MKTAIILFVICLLGFALRTYHITINPPSTYWDEPAIGYNAFSILKTGQDEWGKPFPILFRSFDDYKLPVYIYTVAAFERLLGPTDLAIRLPSAIGGTLTVFFFFYLIKELTYLHSQNSRQNWRNKIGLVGALLFAIAPWHLQFTRAGFEAGLNSLFVVIGVWFFLVSVRKHIWFLLPSLIFFSIATMTYHNSRIFSPIFLFSAVVFFWKYFLKKWKQVLIILLIVFAINLPVLSTWFSNEGRSRLTSQSVLHQPGDLLTNIQGNYAANFSFDYLFFHGDQDGRHSVKKMGELFLWQMPLILLALFFLIRKKNKLTLVIISWLLISPIPAAITNVSPHSLRGSLMIMPLSILTVIGIFLIHKKYSFLSLLLCPIVAYSLFFYLHLYYFFYPRAYAADWQDGYRTAAEFVNKAQNNYNQIFVQSELPPIYLLYYTQFPPEEIHRSNHNLKSFGKFAYFSYFSDPPKRDLSKKDLILAGYKSVPKDKIILKNINMTNGDPVFKIYEF